MKDIQDSVRRLQNFYSSLARIINSGSVVVLNHREIEATLSHIQQLKIKVQPYSKSCTFMLEDIQSKLFVSNPNGSISINPFRFGKLEDVLLYLESSDFVSDFENM